MEKAIPENRTMVQITPETPTIEKIMMEETILKNCTLEKIMPESPMMEQILPQRPSS